MKECFSPFCSDVKEPLKSYVGAVFAVPATNLYPKANKKEILTVAIACEAIPPSATQPAARKLLKDFPTFSDIRLKINSAAIIQSAPPAAPDAAIPQFPESPQSPESLPGSNLSDAAPSLGG